VALLTEHRNQMVARCAKLGAGFDERRFVFSYQPDHSRPCSPSGITHRYARMVATTAALVLPVAQSESSVLIARRPLQGGRSCFDAIEELLYSRNQQVATEGTGG